VGQLKRIIECGALCDVIGDSLQPADSSRLRIGDCLAELACCTAVIRRLLFLLRREIVTLQIGVVEMDRRLAR
jgi:hypothetical protein